MNAILSRPWIPLVMVAVGFLMAGIGFTAAAYTHFILFHACNVLEVAPGKAKIERAQYVSENPSSERSASRR